jgi:single-stranded-DNA-specific exonuclease
MQEDAFKIAEKNIDLDSKMLIAEHEDFHEWIVWIVSWKITEKYNKPSVVFKIDNEKWLAVWSLRWPEYFNVIEMLQQNADILERFWGHKWAGWLSVKLENLPELKERIKQYCAEKISDEDLEKITYIDTKFYENERDTELIKKIANLWPFGEWNPEPQFLFENIQIENIQKVWKNGNGHMKISWLLWSKKIDFLFWWKWDMVENIENKKEISIVWKIKKDDFNGWYSVVWVEIL